ncbi:MAG: F0F1 ATP synthase subunit B [Robiginitomaculum sp.]|nr:F0F1 ATP synthase subunit B [Robiginitomaculum sp.]
MYFGWLFDFSNPTMWVALALLSFFAVMLYLKLPKTLSKSLDDRADKIREELNQARLLREQAQELLANYTRKQREAEQEAENIIKQAKKEAKLYAADMRTKLAEQLERRAETANRRIEQAQAQAETLVRNQAIDLAVKAAEIALETAVPKTAKTKLIDNSIKEMTTKF